MGVLQVLDQTINSQLNTSAYFSPQEKTDAINVAQVEYFKELVQPFQRQNADQKAFQEDSLQYSLINQFYKTGVVSSPTATNLGVNAWDLTTLLDEGQEIYDWLVLLADYGAQVSTVKVLPDNQVRARVKSTLVAPTEALPIGEYFPDFKFAVYPEPENLQAKFLITPQPCNIVYTSGAYDPALSTDLQWGFDSLNALLTRTFQYLGITGRNPNITGLGSNLSRETV